MIDNPLIKLRWLLLQRTLAQPSRVVGFADGAYELDDLRARLEDVHAVLESAPGTHSGAASVVGALVQGAHGYPLALKLQIAELALAYVTVQLLHFAQIRCERELTESERHFGHLDLNSMMRDAFALLQTALEKQPD